jgi:hypothetical protein
MKVLVHLTAKLRIPRFARDDKFRTEDDKIGEREVFALRQAQGLDDKIVANSLCSPGPL